MAVVIFFALMNIGTFINGTISQSLEDTLPTNIASGSINSIYWDNASGNGTIAYRNTTLPTDCTAGEIKATSGINVNNNGTNSIWFNLSANGGTVYNQTIAAGGWYNRTLTQVIAATAMTDDSTYANYSWLTNMSTNRVRIFYVGSYYQSGDYRTTVQNNTVDTLGSLSDGYGGNTDIMIVAAIITVITIPLAAVVAIKKLM